MALLYLYDERPVRWLAVEYDAAAQEITAVVFANLTNRPWPIRYDWKNQTGQEYRVPAQTAQTAIGIPPGQRKFIPLDGSTGRYGFDSEIGSWSA